MCLHEKARQHIVNMYIMITKSRNLYLYIYIYFNQKSIVKNKLKTKQSILVKLFVPI